MSGAPNMAIQCLMKASTISSFCFEDTTAAVLKRVALSMICKNLVPLISLKSSETVLVNALDKKKHWFQTWLFILSAYFTAIVGFYKLFQ